jgi:hypothetical protein
LALFLVGVVVVVAVVVIYHSSFAGDEERETDDEGRWRLGCLGCLVCFVSRRWVLAWLVGSDNFFSNFHLGFAALQIDENNSMSKLKL